MSYYVYILESLKDGSYYIGYTSDLNRRLDMHNTSKKGYTSRKKPWKIVYSEKFEHKSESIKREKFLKRQKNRAFYEALISSYKNN